jgi:hypothetical protein
MTIDNRLVTLPLDAIIAFLRCGSLPLELPALNSTWTDFRVVLGSCDFAYQALRKLTL